MDGAQTIVDGVAERRMRTPSASPRQQSARSSAPATPTGSAPAVSEEGKTPRASGRKGFVSRDALLSLLEEEQSLTLTAGNEAELSALVHQQQDRLVASSFGSDAQALYMSALELAKAKQFTAAKNYLRFSLMHDPPSAESNEACRVAVDSSRGAAKKAGTVGYTWGDFPDEWKNRLHMTHRLMLAKPHRPAEETIVWVRMLASDVCAGPSSHLILAMVSVLCRELLDENRFAPPAKVMCFVEKTATWTAGILLPPEDVKNGKKGPKGPTPMAGRPAAARLGVEEETGESKTTRPPELHDRLFSAKTAARAVTVGQTVRKVDSEPTFRVRLNSTADNPQRTTSLKANEILRDVGHSSAKPYVPGVLLLEAAARGQDALVKALLLAGVSIYEADTEASTALHHAAFRCNSHGHRMVCLLLMEHGADPEMPNAHGLSAWDCALYRRDTKLRRTFRPSESDKDFTEKARLSGDLHRVIGTRDEKIALSLLQHPMPPIVNGITALMMAARSGQLRVVQACLNSGWNVEQRSISGCSALNIAAEEGHAHVLKAMLATSVPEYRLLVADSCGNTPLMRACENGHIDTADLLLESCSADMVNLTSDTGWTALMLACVNGFDEVVAALIEYGARPQMSRLEGTTKGKEFTPLCYAVCSGNVECVRVLIDSGVPLSTQRGATALRLAQRQCQGEIELELRAVLAKDDLDGTTANAETESLPKVAQRSSTLAPTSSVAPKRSKAVAARLLRKVAGKAPAAESLSHAPAADTTMVAAQSDATSASNCEALVSAPAPGEASANASMGIEHQPKASSSGGVAGETLKAEEIPEVKTEADLVKEVEHLTRQLVELREDKTRVRVAKDAAKTRASKQPWVFSYSGKWLPGLLAGMWDRDTPISLQHGAPPDSVSFAKTDPTTRERRV
jgi:ankyrin repeat protein